MAITTTQLGGPISGSSILRATIRVQCGGKNIVMNQDFWVNPTGFTPGAFLGDMANTIQTAVDASLQGICTIETDLVDTQVHQLFPHVPPNIPLPGIATTTSVGSLANPTGDRCAALVITKLTQTSGKFGRGRMYLPPPPASYYTAFGKPTAGYITNATAFYAALWGVTSVTSGVGTTPLVHVIWNRKITTYQIQTTYRVNSVFGTQRRRGYYRVARHKKKT